MEKTKIIKKAQYFGTMINRNFRFKDNNCKCVGVCLDENDHCHISFRSDKNNGMIPDITIELPNDQHQLNYISPIDNCTKKKFESEEKVNEYLSKLFFSKAARQKAVSYQCELCGKWHFSMNFKITQKQKS